MLIEELLAEGIHDLFAHATAALDNFSVLSESLK
jgi:hypothetical protein